MTSGINFLQERTWRLIPYAYQTKFKIRFWWNIFSFFSFFSFFFYLNFVAIWYILHSGTICVELLSIILSGTLHPSVNIFGFLIDHTTQYWIAGKWCSVMCENVSTYFAQDCDDNFESKRTIIKEDNFAGEKFRELWLLSRKFMFWNIFFQQVQIILYSRNSDYSRHAKY